MAKAKLLLARVLVDALIHGSIAVKVNDVVEGTATDIGSLEKSGLVDADKKAVAYAQSLAPGSETIQISEADEQDNAAELQAAKDAVAAAEKKLSEATSEQDKTTATTELDAAKAALAKLGS